ncbi:MAG: cation:proton antiporter [Nitrospinae bacterium]|nr:cation:proton antiporter [Nitrospinota bacterium]
MPHALSLTHAEITSTMLTLGVLLAMARLFGEIAKRINQPAVVGEILAGIILGPTICGTFFPDMVSFITPTEHAKLFLNGFTSVAVALFLLVAGIEVDLTSVWRQGKTAMTVSVLGILTPFTLGIFTVILFPETLALPSGVDMGIYALFFATALSISALPVIAKTLMDLDIYRTDIGMVVIASAMLDDIVGWIIFAMVLGMMGSGLASTMPIWGTVALALLFAGGMLTVGRFSLNRILPILNERTSWPGGVLGFAVSLAFIGAAFTEWIGLHAVFGAFMVGVALGDSPHLRQKTKQTIEQFVSFIFAPLFFASIGLKVNFITNFDPALTLMVLAIASLGKIGGCGAGARFAGMGAREAWAIGFGMNARGAMEIILALLALQAGIIGQTMFVALVIMAIFTSMVSGPGMQAILGRKRARKLEEHFSENAFEMAMRADTREEAIAELSSLLAEETGLAADRIEQAVLSRELIMPTGLDNGMAIPHARIKGLSTPVIAVGLSDSGVDFDARDGQPAQLVFLILTPEGDDKAQIEILAQISKLLKDPVCREKLKKSKNFLEFMAALKQGAAGK